MLPAAVHRIAPVVNVFSAVVMIFALTMAAPLAISLIYDDAALLMYDKAIAITFFAGGNRTGPSIGLKRNASIPRHLTGIRSTHGIPLRKRNTASRWKRYAGPSRQVATTRPT